jgi:thiol-disulfide isomerase/thioredoxin
MRSIWHIVFVALALWARLALGQASTPTPPPEFTHHSDADWVNSAPLTLAALKGKVVLVEFWAFECANCLNSREWVESVARAKGPAGLVVIGVHTPELPEEKSASKVRDAVQRLGIDYPVMIDTDYSYWKALHNQYWPTFYLIGRDGKLYGHANGEQHVGQDSAKRVEQALDLLLAAPAA